MERQFADGAAVEGLTLVLEAAAGLGRIVASETKAPNMLATLA
jgi:hypothetical protein